MSNKEVKPVEQLAEEKYPLQPTHDLTVNELENVVSENFYQLKRREGFIAGYQLGEKSSYSIEQIRQAGRDGEISSIDVEHLINILLNPETKQ